MNITFSTSGLCFEAAVKYFPGRPAKLYGLPENCYEEEPAEVEFESLTVDGNNALFILDSSLSNDIFNAAIKAAGEKKVEERNEAAIARYESRRDAA